MNKPRAEGNLLRYVGLSIFAGIIYFLSDPRPQYYYDYTFRVAVGFLNGQLGLTDQPPTWVNEFIPLDDRFYSAFPLGSVLTMIPWAALKELGILSEMPGRLIAAITASAICYLLFQIASQYDAIGWNRRILLVAGFMFGTWMWADLVFAGAWQLALGFAVVGELGAIYFTVFDRRPVLAGFFFALAFGNRTEVLLTAPVFYYLLGRQDPQALGPNDAEIYPDTERASPRNPAKLKTYVWFSAFPILLGVATLIYNYLRFGSPIDFGYSRIPGVLSEPWYQHGIFSINYVPRQAFEMVLKPWNLISTFPYLVPDGFSSSILISSPFFLFALGSQARDRLLKKVSWVTVFILTFLLWTHGNSGGWQFGYRYAMVLLPWLFIILLENSPDRISRAERAVYVVAIAINIYAVILFHWTDVLHP